jgi:hypothetical protein
LINAAGQLRSLESENSRLKKLLAEAALDYEPRLTAKDAPVIEAMKVLSAQYPA